MKKTLFFIFAVLFAMGVNAQWINQDTNFPDESTGVNCISIANEDVVWISGYDASPADKSANLRVISKTTDGGETWVASKIEAIPAGCDIAMIHAIDADNAWVVAYPTTQTATGQGIYRTSDGGATWVKQESASFSGSTSFANVVWMDAEGNGFCQGDPLDGYFELYTTTDFGENWTRVPQENIPAPLAGEYGYVSQIFTAGNTIWFTTNKGRIFRSKDKGMTWEAFQSPISDFGSAASAGTLDFSDDNKGVLLNRNKKLWKTTDGGETWTALAKDAPYDSDIAVVPGTSFLVAVSADADPLEDMGSAFSQDFGENWVTLTNADLQYLHVAFIENFVGWAGTFRMKNEQGQVVVGGMLKYDGPTSISVENINEEANIVCFPNPLNDFLQVEAKSNIVEVRIVNFLGQEIKRINGDSKYMSLDLSEMAKGVYFVEVNSLDGKQVVKVLKK